MSKREPHEQEYKEDSEIWKRGWEIGSNPPSHPSRHCLIHCDITSIISNAAKYIKGSGFENHVSGNEQLPRILRPWPPPPTTTATNAFFIPAALASEPSDWGRLKSCLTDSVAVQDLRIAAGQGNLEKVKELMDLSYFDVNARNKMQGSVSGHQLAFSNRQSIVSIFKILSLVFACFCVCLTSNCRANENRFNIACV